MRNFLWFLLGDYATVGWRALINRATPSRRVCREAEKWNCQNIGLPKFKYKVELVIKWRTCQFKWKRSNAFSPAPSNKVYGCAVLTPLLFALLFFYSYFISGILFDSISESAHLNKFYSGTSGIWYMNDFRYMKWNLHLEITAAHFEQWQQNRDI